MKKDKELGASTDAGEVGTLAVSLPGLATRRVARTTVSPQCRTRPHRWEQHGEGRRTAVNLVLVLHVHVQMYSCSRCLQLYGTFGLKCLLQIGL